MRTDKLPSGSFRARKMYKGKQYQIIFDHEPTEKELIIAFAEKLQDSSAKNGTFEKYALEYIENRKGTISPATERTYNIKIKQISDGFKAKNIYDIDSEDVQREISLFSQDHAPKTTKSLYGFISSVLAVNRPNLKLRVKLPQAIVKDEYEPSKKDIKRLLEHSRGTDYSIPFQLGVMGCRRGEICALSIDDLKGNELRIHRSMVYDSENKWVVKESPKTDASNRTLFLPDKLADEIREQGYIYNNHPGALNKAIHRYQKKLGIPAFKFHALRSYFCSYAHSIGIPDADIMSIGGWKSDVMKRVYRKSLEQSKAKSMKKITRGLLNI